MLYRSPIQPELWLGAWKGASDSTNFTPSAAPGGLKRFITEQTEKYSE